jgi:hypothetical protein
VTEDLRSDREAHEPQLIETAEILARAAIARLRGDG